MKGKNQAAMSNKIVVKKPTSAQSGPKTQILKGATPNKYKKCQICDHLHIVWQVEEIPSLPEVDMVYFPTCRNAGGPPKM